MTRSLLLVAPHDAVHDDPSFQALGGVSFEGNVTGVEGRERRERARGRGIACGDGGSEEQRAKNDAMLLQSTDGHDRLQLKGAGYVSPTIRQHRYAE